MNTEIYYCYDFTLSLQIFVELPDLCLDFFNISMWLHHDDHSKDGVKVNIMYVII